MSLLGKSMAVNHLHDHHWSPKSIDMNHAAVVVDVGLRCLYCLRIIHKSVNGRMQTRNAKRLIINGTG